MKKYSKLNCFCISGVWKKYSYVAELKENICINEGNAYSCHLAGVLYKSGEFGVKPNYEKALKLFKKGYEAKEDNQYKFNSYSTLGVVYLDGYRTKQNYKKAIELFTAYCQGGDGCLFWDCGYV